MYACNSVFKQTIIFLKRMYQMKTWMILSLYLCLSFGGEKLAKGRCARALGFLHLKDLNLFTVPTAKSF